MSLLLSVPYTYRKDGIYYLQRYVPEDVRQHYKTYLPKTESVFELCTVLSASKELLASHYLVVTLFGSPMRGHRDA
jgi:hypothetical protein